MVGEHTSIIEVHRGKGLVDPVHAHGDHESLCYLVSGRMRVIIEDESLSPSQVTRGFTAWGCALSRNLGRLGTA